jgi:hypothetical protein
VGQQGRRKGGCSKDAWELTLSRIWDALKLAERQRSAAQSRARAEVRTDDIPNGASDRRKGLRHMHSVPLLVYGSDADKQPFHE